MSSGNPELVEIYDAGNTVAGPNYTIAGPNYMVLGADGRIIQQNFRTEIEAIDWAIQQGFQIEEK